jgi:hypothetical protein
MADDVGEAIGERHVDAASDLPKERAPRRFTLQRIVRNRRSASAKMHPVFRAEQCASQEDEHRMDPKKWNPLWGPMLEEGRRCDQREDRASQAHEKAAPER